jgi:arylsulfatase A-like enzyme
MFKGVMYDSSTRVPMIFRAPGKLPKGKSVDAVLDNTAVMPTLLELAGIPIPGGIQGRSLVSLANGNSKNWPGTAFSYLESRMVREGDWKLIVHDLAGNGSAPEIYRMSDDPSEERNLYGKTEAAEAQRRLETLLKEWWNQKPPAVRLP